jgi:glycosyl transferase family 25
VPSPLAVERVFVVHVKKGLEERGRFISEQFARHGIEFSFVLDADRDELTDEMLDTYFGDALKARTANTSCTAKHLLAYEAMLREGIGSALVFEDDIILSPDFVERCNAAVAEARTRPDVARGNVIVSLENSELRLVPPEEVVPGRLLYRRDAGRCAGAYYIDLEAARTVVEHARRVKIREGAMDWFHNEVLRATPLSMYWCHPPIAEQGSHNGMFTSVLLNGKKGGWVRRLRWKLQKWYKYRVRYGVRD